MVGVSLLKHKPGVKACSAMKVQKDMGDDMLLSRRALAQAHPACAGHGNVPSAPGAQAVCMPCTS